LAVLYQNSNFWGDVGTAVEMCNFVFLSHSLLYVTVVCITVEQDGLHSDTEMRDEFKPEFYKSRNSVSFNSEKSL
jgi:hypothetical protein